MSGVESIPAPTVSLEVLSTKLIMDKYEEWYVATFDVPEAYLHVKIITGKIVILKVLGSFIDIMCDINIESKANVRYRRGQKVIYIYIEGNILVH